VVKFGKVIFTRPNFIGCKCAPLVCLGLCTELCRVAGNKYVIWYHMAGDAP